jgi:RNA polymerase sigma factor (sigma-70 family)
MEPQIRERLGEALAQLAADRKDEGAWRMLFDCSWATALSTANRILRGQLDIARDVAQEVFQRVVRYCDFGQLKDPDAFLLYLKAISRNAARDAARALGAAAVVESVEESVIENLRVSPETPENLVRAQQLMSELLVQLDEESRDLLNLLIQGYTVAEIAARLNLSYSNAGVRLHRLRQLLRNYLKEREINK